MRTSSSIEVVINENIIKTQVGSTILQTCEQIGIQIPRFCYHEQLSIAGNCRMCLVEVDSSIKPIAACAIGVEPNMKIFTNTALVKKAREGVLEFLLINHPLDCPICDQGGECDLQDQTILFGNDRGRFYEIKRAVSELELGPFVKTVMTRCIHCTRCVRFLTELGGSMELGTLGRGNKTEISSYVYKILDSEVSGNIIDLCPVGALTAKPYAFTNRPWELTKIETIDLLDSMGSNLSYQLYGEKLVRVLPVIHSGINEEWLADKTRFSYDGFVIQRLVKPLIKQNRKYSTIKWSNILNNLVSIIDEKYLLIVNNTLSLEIIYLIKFFINLYNNVQCIIKDNFIKRDSDFRVLYIFNSTYNKLKESDVCCIIGCNLKKEMPLLLVKLRKEKRVKRIELLIFGLFEKLSLDEISLGVRVANLLKFSEGKHYGSIFIKKAKLASIILGNNIINNIYCNEISKVLLNIKQLKWDNINFVEQGAGNIGLLEVGVQSKINLKKNNVDKFVNFNVNNYLISKQKKVKIFMGTHGDNLLSQYDLIVPIAANIETEGLFINNEGRVQVAKKVQKAPLQTKIDWQFFCKVFHYLFAKVINNRIKRENIQAEISKEYNLNLNMVGYINFFKYKRKKIKIFNGVILPGIMKIEKQNVIIKYSRIMTKAKVFILKNIYN